VRPQAFEDTVRYSTGIALAPIKNRCTREG